MRQTFLQRHRTLPPAPYFIALIIATFSLWLLSSRSAQGQVQTLPITPSGLNTAVSDPITVAGQTQYNITGGTRPNGGPNLFHSFGDFNVPANTIANFNNDSGLATSNILGRVTGGNPSSIFGTIQTTEFGHANLFLMNPSGIVFGPNASLNVGGSVVFTTANYLRLAEIDGTAGIFHANLASSSLLTSAPVASFGFLGSNPAAITVRGSTLSVADKTGISLVGGNITIESGTLADGTVRTAKLFAPNGKIQLAITASSGEFDVMLKPLPNVDEISFTSFGSVSLAPGSTVNVSGTNTIAIRGGQFALIVNDAIFSSTDGSSPQETISLNPMSSIISSNTGAEVGADVQIRTRAFQMKGATIQATSTGGGQSGAVSISASDEASFTDSTIDTRSILPTNPLFSNGKGGAVTVTAPTVSMEGSLIITSVIGDGITSTTASSGAVRLSSTKSISLRRSDVITESFNTKGNAGAVTIAAPTITVRGLREQGIITSTHGSLEDPVALGHLVSGDGGDIKITGTTVTFTDSARLKSEADGEGTFGRGGNILISGGQNILLEKETSFVTSTLSLGKAGNIELESPHVTIKGQSTLASDTFGPGNGGTIKITGAEKIALESGSTISSTATSPSQGAAGDIEFKSANLMITGGIFTNTEGTGQAGNIVLNVGTVTLQNGGIISASTKGPAPSATGGSITVNATDQVTLTNGASITASSTGAANAGNISIDAGQRFDMQDSSVTTESKLASGGNIDIKAIDLIRVANSKISTSVQGDSSTAGGNIMIDPKTVVLQNAQIFAKADQGNGGNIKIVTPTFLADQSSSIDASSQRGISGTVTIQSPTSNLSGTVAQLSSKTDQTQPLLQNRCVALAGGEQSTFILSGRDTLPAEPGGWLSSPVSMEHWTGGDTEEHASGLMVRRKGPNGLPAMAAHKNKPHVLSLRRLTPPGFLVRAFATGSTGCPS